MPELATSFVVTDQFAGCDFSVSSSQGFASGDRVVARTLEDAYRELVLPVKSSTSRKQVTTHRTAIGQFMEFLGQGNHRCTEPIPVLNGSRQVVRQFAEWLVKHRQNSATTASHRVTHLMMICRAMQSAGWIQRLPAAPQREDLYSLERSFQRPVRKVSKSVSFEDAARLIEACNVATYPCLGDFSPAEFWRRMILWHALYGPRTQDVYAYSERSKLGLLWSDVHFSPLCPDPDVLQALPDLQSPHGWIYYPVGKDRKSECPFVLFPMPQWMAEFVGAMQGLTDPAKQDRVFPVSRNAKKFGATWASIRRAAGVADSVYLSQGTGKASSFRKTAARWWKRVTGSSEVAQYVLHHAEVTTAARHYLDTMETVLPLILRHLPSFPLTL